MDRPWHKSPLAWTSLLLVALAVRLGGAAWWQERLPEGMRFGFGDSESYWQLGQKLSRGEPYRYGENGPQIFRTPGYPLLLAGLFRIVPGGPDGPHVFWGRALSAVLGCSAVALVAVLASHLFDTQSAFVAAACATFYPEAVAASVFILSEAPFGPPFLVQLIAWTLAWKSATPRGQVGWSLVAGIAAGVATLVRPSWLLFTPFAIGIGLLAASDRRRQLLIGLVMLAGFSLAMSPWWIRNHRIAGRFVPTTLQVGASLYDGLNPDATGASDMQFVPQFAAEQQAADAAAIAAGGKPAGIFEDRLDRRHHAAAMAWARENPRRVLKLAAIKFARLWSPLPNAAEFRSLWLRVILAATYTPVLLVGLYGAWRFVPRGWPYVLCLLPAIYFTLLHVVFVSSIRYRQPAMLTLIVLASPIAAAWIARKPETQTTR